MPRVFQQNKPKVPISFNSARIEFSIAPGLKTVILAHEKCEIQNFGTGELMSAYVIFDVEIYDIDQYQEFMLGVKPALEKAGAKYLSRGGEHKVYEGDWEPRRIVLLEFPSISHWEEFYNGATYQGLKAVRDACSTARLVGVEGNS